MKCQFYQSIGIGGIKEIHGRIFVIVGTPTIDNNT